MILRNRNKYALLGAVFVSIQLIVCSPATAQEPQEAEVSENYTQAYYAAGRFALGFSFLVGIATAQSFVSQHVAGYPFLSSAANYVFMPLTLSFSMLTLTPLQSWVGKYLHGAFAPPDSIKEQALPEDGLEGLWFRTYQAYSMNAQMSRNVVLALNSLSFFYLDRIQRYLDAGDIDAGLKTQAHFFRMAEKYFAEVQLNSPIWEDVFIPHAQLLWENYRDEVDMDLRQYGFPTDAEEFFFSRILENDAP